MLDIRRKRLLADECNGERALNHVKEIAKYDRAQGSSQFHVAATYLKDYLSQVGVPATFLEFPLDNKTKLADGITSYAWEPQDAILRMVYPEEKTLADYQMVPGCLTAFSAATPLEGVTTDLVYVGDGTRDEDYQHVDVKGKIVLVDRGYNRATYLLACEKYGALGFICDDIREVAPVKTRAEFPDMVIWTTMNRRGSDGEAIKGWCMSISPRNGDYLRQLVKAGPVKLYAKVITKTFPGVMENPLGIIEGSKYPDEEVLYVAHLCHTKPSAIDNASGCAVITEAAESIMRLVTRGETKRPLRSIKFLYGPEGPVSNVYVTLNKDRLGKVIAALSPDCVGADSAVVRGPVQLARTSAATPSFFNDVCIDLLRESSQVYPLVGRARQDSAARFTGEPIEMVDGVSRFKFEIVPLGYQSDNTVLSGWGVPSVGLVQWPNLYWHTPQDTPDKLDPEEMRRMSWVVAAAGLTVADAGIAEAIELMHQVEAESERRLIRVSQRALKELPGQNSRESKRLLDRRIDELKYTMERDAQAIASATVLVRNAEKEIRALAARVARQQSRKLAAKAKLEEKELISIARIRSGKGRGSDAKNR